MSNETKQDVFDEVRYKFRNFKNEHRHGMYVSPDSVDHYLSDALKRYYAALPDDLPVVSKDVSNSMRTYRFLWWKEFLDKAYDNELSGDEDINYKVRSESAEVARAWLLGVWEVKETGEIVKLEADHG